MIISKSLPFTPRSPIPFYVSPFDFAEKEKIQFLSFDSTIHFYSNLDSLEKRRVKMGPY
jgi:hypothetical protein